MQHNEIELSSEPPHLYLITITSICY